MLITFQPPTRAMRTEVTSAGSYYSPRWHRRYPRLQLPMVADLLAGKKFDCPPLSQVNRTMPKARRYQRASEAEQRPLTRAGMVAVK